MPLLAHLTKFVKANYDRLSLKRYPTPLTAIMYWGFLRSASILPRNRLTIALTDSYSRILSPKHVWEDTDNQGTPGIENKFPNQFVFFLRYCRVFPIYEDLMFGEINQQSTITKNLPLRQHGFLYRNGGVKLQLAPSVLPRQMVSWHSRPRRVRRSLLCQLYPPWH